MLVNEVLIPEPSAVGEGGLSTTAISAGVVATLAAETWDHLVEEHPTVPVVFLLEATLLLFSRAKNSKVLRALRGLCEQLKRDSADIFSLRPIILKASNLQVHPALCVNLTTQSLVSLRFISVLKREGIDPSLVFLFDFLLHFVVEGVQEDVLFVVTEASVLLSALSDPLYFALFVFFLFLLLLGGELLFLVRHL